MGSSGFDKNIKDKLEGFEMDVTPNEADIARISGNLYSRPSRLTNRLLYVTIGLLVILLFFRTCNYGQENISNRGLSLLQLKIDSLYKETNLLRGQLNDTSSIGVRNTNRITISTIELLKKELLDSIREDQRKNASKQQYSRVSPYNQNRLSSSEMISAIQSDEGLQEQLIKALFNEQGFKEKLIKIKQDHDSRIKEEREDSSNDSFFSEKVIENPKQVTVLLEELAFQNGKRTSSLRDERLTKENIGLLSETEKKRLFQELYQNDPKKIEEILNDPTLLIENAELKALKDSLTAELIKKTPQNSVDTVFIENKNKEKTPIPVTWSMGGGIGLGVASLTSGGDFTNLSFESHLQAKLGEHFAVVSGVEFSIIAGEQQGLSDLKVDQFDDLSEDILVDAKEFKVKITYLDVPLELRYYILSKKKWSPFVSLGIQNRLLIKDEYKLEIIRNNEEENITISRSGPSFGVGGVKAGAGIQFKMGDQLDGLLRGTYLKGFENMGEIDNQLNSKMLDFTILYRFE